MRHSKEQVPPAIQDRVKQALQRHAGNARRVGVAVSGGADSVCLFLILRELVDTHILHLNHQLRADESDADETFVRALATRFAVPIHVKRLDVAALGGNLEETARLARYEFYRQVIETSVDCVATGHTRSDQAETVLFRLLRGSHLAGLAAIHPVTAGPVIRPLLDVSREEVEQYLRDAHEPWREDSSNRDLSFDRNRIRQVLLPELKRDWNPEIERSLAQMATLAFDEERFWAGWMTQHSREFLEFRGNIALASASKLTAQPVAVARRLIRQAIEHVKGSLHSIDFAHGEAILELAQRKEGAGRLQIPQVDVYRSFDWLRFAPIAEGDQLAARNQQCVCTVPGRMRLPVAEVAIDLEVIETSGNLGAHEGALESARVKEYELDWDLVLELGSELRLRTWKPGDQYRTALAGSPAKVKTMFQEWRVPLWDRGTWPIITVASKVIWSREFGPAVEVATHGKTRRFLKIKDRRSGEIPTN